MGGGRELPAMRVWRSAAEQDLGAQRPEWRTMELLHSRGTPAWPRISFLIDRDTEEGEGTVGAAVEVRQVGGGPLLVFLSL